MTGLLATDAAAAGPLAAGPPDSVRDFSCLFRDNAKIRCGGAAGGAQPWL